MYQTTVLECQRKNIFIKLKLYQALEIFKILIVRFRFRVYFFVCLLAFCLFLCSTDNEKALTFPSVK